MDVYVSIIDGAEGPGDIVDINRDIPGAIEKARAGKPMMIFAEPDLYERAKQKLEWELAKAPLPDDCAGTVDVVRGLFFTTADGRGAYAVHPDDLSPHLADGKPKHAVNERSAATMQAFRAGVPQELLRRLDALTEKQRVALFACYCRSCGSTDLGCVCWKDE